MSELAPENGATAPEPEAPVVEPVAEETPPEPEWAGPSREEWQAAQQFQEAAGPVLHQIAVNMGLIQPQQQASQQQPAPELDPWDPNSVKGYIDYQVQSRTADYDNMLRLVEAQQGEQLARQELDRLHTQYGEFDGDTALVIASGLLDQGVAPHQALDQAAQLLRDHEAKVRADERQRHGVTLQNINEAPKEGSGNTGIAQETERVPMGKDRYEQAVERYLAGQRAGLPIG